MPEPCTTKLFHGAWVLGLGYNKLLQLDTLIKSIVDIESDGDMICSDSWDV
jgi:hypothetical protein